MQAGAVTFVIDDGYDSLDLAGPYEMFGEAGYQLHVVAQKPARVRSSKGLAVHAEDSIRATDPHTVDTLVAVGGDGVFNARANGRLLAWVTEAARSARRVTSVCNGAFLLSETGLLTGRRVTAHWRIANQLAGERWLSRTIL